MSGTTRRAMTLIELLVAVALGMLVVGLAWTAFLRAGSSTARATARVDLHASAAVVREFLQRDVGCMSPTVACFMRSLPGVVSGTTRSDTVELLFMRMVDRLTSETSGSSREQHKSELTWVRWRFVRSWTQDGAGWKAAGGALYRSSSTPAREFATLAAWTTPVPLQDPIAHTTPWANYGGRLWLNLPRPIRDASHGIDALDFNRYGVDPAHIGTARGDMTDIGDLADLDREGNERLVSSRIRDLAIGWVDAGGTAHQIVSSTAADHRIDGLHMDVTGPAGNAYLAQLARRPRLVRVAFSMRDDASGVVQDFSFSAAAPGMLPEVGR